MSLHHPRWLRTITAIILAAVASAATASSTVVPKGYGYDGKLHASAAQACSAYAQAAQGTATGRPEYADGNVRCHYKDSTGFPSTVETISIECPDESNPVALNECACWNDKVVSGGKCVAPDEARQSVRTAQEPRATNAPAPAAAAPSKQLLRELAPISSTVRMVTTLDFSCPSPLSQVRNPADFKALTKVDPASGKKVDLQVSMLPLTAAQSRGGQSNSGGVLIRPEAGSSRLQLVTWNTKDAKKDSNVSHAEEQLAYWLRHQGALGGCLKSVSVDIQRSPCSECGNSLCGLMQEIRAAQGGRAPIQASLTYDRLHTGKNATTADDIKALETCGWRIDKAVKK